MTNIDMLLADWRQNFIIRLHASYFPRADCSISAANLVV